MLGFDTKNHDPVILSVSGTSPCGVISLFIYICKPLKF